MRSELRPAAATGLWIFSAALACTVLATWITMVIRAGVNADAGDFIPHALLVLAGDIPCRDFPSGYPPGIYYLLATVGEQGLRSPVVFKLVVCVAQDRAGTRG